MADGILLAGEAMGLLTALEEGPLEKAETFRSASGGLFHKIGGRPLWAPDPKGDAS